MTIIYTVAMNKGGVGKTSFVTNAATILATRFKKKVLIVDMDAQGNSAMAFGVNPVQLQNTIYDVLLEKTEAKNILIPLIENLDLLPANDEMNFFEIDVLPKAKDYPNPFVLLKNALQDIQDPYDMILIDTPPSIGIVTGNALVAADKVIIPFVPETFATKGLVKLIETVQNMKGSHNPKLEIAAVIGMMADRRTILHTEMLKQAKDYCEKKEILLPGFIPKTIEFAKSTAYEEKPVTWGQTRNPMTKAYVELVKEVFVV